MIPRLSLSRILTFDRMRQENHGTSYAVIALEYLRSYQMSGYVSELAKSPGMPKEETTEL
jgi:hypothetical protein